MSILFVSQALLWALLLGLCAVVLALARQIGILHERIAPVGALLTGNGPAVGARAPVVIGRLLNGGTLVVGERLAAGQAQLLLFISAQCPICKKIIPLAKSVAAAERLELIFVGDDAVTEQRKLIEQWGLEAFPFVNGPELGMSFQIGKLPYGVLLNEAGEVAAKGLVNTREHLESLVVAKTTGFGSVQAYIQQQAGRLEVELP